MIATLFARKARAGRRVPTRLRVDELEGRDVPSAYWVGDFSTDATDARNWYPYNQPPAGDLWFYGSGSLYDEVEGEWIDRPLGNACYGLPGGSYDNVYVGAGYANTITLDSDTTMLRLWMDSEAATIDQAGHDLTITGSTDPGSAPADLYWTGGTITSSTTPATVSVVGGLPDNQVTTALISTAATAAVTLGSNLLFDAGAEAEIAAQVNMTGATGIDVLGGSGLTLANGTALLSALTAIEQRHTIRVFGMPSRLFTRGAATVDLGLWVDGGTAELQGVATGTATVTFRGPVRQLNGAVPPGAPPNFAMSAYMTSGRLIIGEGARLDVSETRYVVVQGGKLATRVTAVNATHRASITGNVIVEQTTGVMTEVVISDPSLNPPGVTQYFYGELYVAGTVAWYGGTYRPLINPTGSGTPSSLWFATGNFYISQSNLPGATGPVLGPACYQQPPPIGNTYVIIASGAGQITRRVNPAFDPLDNNWIIREPNNPDQNLVIERI